MELNCSMCGRCCYFLYKGKVKKCPHLIVLDRKKPKSLCRVYNERLTKNIPKLGKCMLRRQLAINYTNCPFNKKGQPTFEEIVDTHKEASRLSPNYSMADYVNDEEV